MNKTNTLHFSFSPVQEFVAQSRRTRDLWAGSYLLSWLAGQAMQEIVKADGGTILLPDVTSDPLFSQICSPVEISLEDRAAYLGSLPNRFTALIPESLDGNICSKALDDAWNRVVQDIYSVISSFLNDNQKDLWAKQTGNFWKCSWVMGEASFLLDRRKNLRLHFPLPEAGDKCTVCGERQELSCNDFPKRKQIHAWWKDLREKSSQVHIHGLDLKENERLCSICLIKRLFPHFAPKALGWQVPEFYPSTAYLSAIDWIIHVLELAGEHEDVKNTAVRLLELVHDPIVKKAETRTWRHIRGIQALIRQTPELQGLSHVDGSVFFIDAVYRKDSNLNNPDKVAIALKALQKSVAKYSPNFCMASPFYALLLMDGDNMGAMLGDLPAEERGQISRALAEFTGQMPDIVDECNGMLIYAGGDDVFALLPVSTAIECARRCRVAYQCSFQTHAPSINRELTTISAAVQYAHMNTALGVVVRDSHRLLEDIAKEKTGRDALACRVWKRGGPILTFSQPWAAIDDGLLLETVQRSFTDETNEPDRFSSKFFYKLRDVFELVGSDGFLDDPANLEDLLVTTYLANREHNWPDKLSGQEILAIAGKRVKQLLCLCLEQKRTVPEDGGRPQIRPTGRYTPDAPLLVRFLTRKEV